MTGARSAARLAIAQQPMAWTTQENVAAIVASLAIAAGQGAVACIFPELALTGFHRGIREQAVPAVVGPALEQVQDACRANRIGCALGLPTFDEAGDVLNSYRYLDAAGAVVATTSKNGLTPSEQTFFVAGRDRPVARFAQARCATVMCREIDDVEAIAAQLRDDPVDLVLWPSLVGHPPGTVHPTPEDTADLGYVRRAAVLARRLAAHVVQSNWPYALNTPGSTYHGQSKVYAPDGEILLTLPRDEPGVGVFMLCERSFDWWPIAA